MPIHFYWGNDEFSLSQAVDQLRSQVVDEAWQDFNFTKISALSDSQIIEGLTIAMTSPFGNGGRLTWLVDCPIGKKCGDELLSHFDRCLPNLPKESHLLLTHPEKPDSRLKITKLLQKYGEIREFSLVPPWQQEAIVEMVDQAVRAAQLPLSREGVEFLAEAIGNDRWRLAQELEKIKLWLGEESQPPTVAELAQLVPSTAHNSLQLGQAIRSGDVNRALGLLGEVLANNEPGIRIVATLSGQFRTWLQVKAIQEAGERDDKVIAQFAELTNPKRVYFLKKEVQSLRAQQLFQALEILVELEANLKRGAEELPTLQTAVITLCGLLAQGGGIGP